MARRRIIPTVKASPELQEAIAHFKPRFGNDDDTAIVRAYQEIIHERSSLSMNAVHLAELEEGIKSSRKRIQDLMREEKNLIYRISNRDVVPSVRPLIPSTDIPF